MTVSANYEVVTYVGDGKTTVFSVPWKFFDDEIEVYINKSLMTYQKGVDYTVENNGNVSGGKVVFQTAPADGSFLTIVRSVVLNQLVTFIEGENFPASDYEYSLDRVIMALQEMYEKVSRCVAFPAGETWETYQGKLIKFSGASAWQETAVYQKGDVISAESDDGNGALWFISLEDYNAGNNPFECLDKWLPMGYSKEAVDMMLALKPSYDEVYVKTEVDALLAGKADAGDFYTKAEVDARIGEIGDVLDLINGEII